MHLSGYLRTFEKHQRFLIPVKETMTSRSRLSRRLAAVASCAAVIAVCLAPQAHANLLGQLDYVALGDSYSAASGVFQPDLTARVP